MHINRTERDLLATAVRAINVAALANETLVAEEIEGAQLFAAAFPLACYDAVAAHPLLVVHA